MDSPASFRTATVTLKELEVGDLIEFRRTAYTHWAVFVGEGFAIHMDLPTKKDTYAKIVKELVVNIAGNDRCRVNNLEKRASKKRLKARAPWEIVSTAESHLGAVIEYQLFSDNCEYFATSCRYGKDVGFSGQVDTFLDGLTFFTVTAAVIAVAAGFITFIRILANRPNRR